MHSQHLRIASSSSREVRHPPLSSRFSPYNRAGRHQLLFRDTLPCYESPLNHGVYHSLFRRDPLTRVFSTHTMTTETVRPLTHFLDCLSFLNPSAVLKWFPPFMESQ